MIPAAWSSRKRIDYLSLLIQTVDEVLPWCGLVACNASPPALSCIYLRSCGCVVVVGGAEDCRRACGFSYVGALCVGQRVERLLSHIKRRSHVRRAEWYVHIQLYAQTRADRGRVRSVQGRVSTRASETGVRKVLVTCEPLVDRDRVHRSDVTSISRERVITLLSLTDALPDSRSALL